MVDDKPLCPVCDMGRLTFHRGSETFTYKNQPLVVDDLEYCLCDACGADPVLADQIRRNQSKITDAKRRMDGMLTGDEICAVRKRLGLSQKEAAELFGGGANAFSKYECGDVMQSVSMERLLRLAYLYPKLLDDLRMLAGMRVEAVDTSHDGYAVRGRAEVDMRRLRLKRPDSVGKITALEAWAPMDMEHQEQLAA